MGVQLSDIPLREGGEVSTGAALPLDEGITKVVADKEGVLPIQHGVVVEATLTHE